MRTVADAATSGLEIVTRKGIVLVLDGADRWLCTGTAWTQALAELSDEECDDEGTAEAYARLCRRIRGPVASVVGTSRGEFADLVGEAYAAGLIDDDDARAYGIEVAP